jgi:hypothetical protein
LRDCPYISGKSIKIKIKIKATGEISTFQVSSLQKVDKLKTEQIQVLSKVPWRSSVAVLQFAFEP